MFFKVKTLLFCTFLQALQIYYYFKMICLHKNIKMSFNWAFISLAMSQCCPTISGILKVRLRENIVVWVKIIMLQMYPLYIMFMMLLHYVCTYNKTHQWLMVFHMTWTAASLLKVLHLFKLTVHLRPPLYSDFSLFTSSFAGIIITTAVRACCLTPNLIIGHNKVLSFSTYMVVIRLRTDWNFIFK